MSRKSDLDRMASLVGNAAAHVALFKEEKESPLYAGQAAEVASKRSWNEREIEYFCSRADARAKSEIRKRIERYGLDSKDFDTYMERATQYVREFVGTFLSVTS